MADATTILSIDGGGIRGVIPAMVLAEIEQRTERRIAELFDLIAGTSTGGLLALGVVCPGDGGAPKFHARDLLAIYEEDGDKIFPPAGPLRRIRQFFDERYPSDGIEAVLKDNFGGARLKDAVKDVMVTAYDIERRRAFFFRSDRAKRATEGPEEYDFEMWKVARATSAAPTYFEPLQVAASPPDPPYALVDGGVFANNPAMCAYVDAIGGDEMTGRDPAGEVFMVSLGTGSLARRFRYRDARRWGLLQWARPILDIVFDGISDATEHQLERILEERYQRFQIDRLKPDLNAMDNASADNVTGLKLEAEQLINERSADLDAVCERLTSAS